MKKFFATAFTALAIATPAQAGQIMPNLYALKFCTALNAGVAWDDASRYAIRESYVSGGYSPKTSSGVDLDVVLAVDAAKRLCPQIMQSAFRFHQEKERSAPAQQPAAAPAYFY